jgi:hypothetical protein
MQNAVSRYLWRRVNNQFHLELHELATGRSALLRPKPPEPEKPAEGPSTGDPDDDLPL